MNENELRNNFNSKMQEKSRFYPKSLAFISFRENVFVLPVRQTGAPAKMPIRDFLNTLP